MFAHAVAVPRVPWLSSAGARPHLIRPLRTRQAYSLDPKAGKEGKEILDQLLTASEKHRANLSIVLAGYKDEIETKLYEANVGMKSRCASRMVQLGRAGRLSPFAKASCCCWSC